MVDAAADALREHPCTRKADLLACRSKFPGHLPDGVIAQLIHSRTEYGAVGAYIYMRNDCGICQRLGFRGLVVMT